MISKELLSDVLGIGELKGLMSFGLSSCKNYIIFQYEDYDDSINIHELAHKCKEWAKTESYMLTTYTHFDTVAVSLTHYTTKNHYNSPSMSVLEEPEAVFEACQWILENKEK